MYTNIPHNFLEIDSINPFRTSYMFIDTINHLADDEFEKRKLPMKSLGEWRDVVGGPYVIRCVRIPSRCTPGFHEVMIELNRRTYTDTRWSDYQTVCAKIIGYVEKTGRNPFYKRLKKIKGIDR